MPSKDMNEIEERFYEAGLYVEGWCDDDSCPLKPKAVVDLYIVDFLYNEKYVIEIDGHDYHKTKEQRFKDYQRERYLMRKGYIVIRFMASEVFVDAEKCIEEMLEIAAVDGERIIEAYDLGYENGKSRKRGGKRG